MNHDPLQGAMDGHFRAFSFVDRLTLLEPGVRVQGSYFVPPGLTEFPASLVAEATGQLAAWAAMAALGFSHRPVAGIAGRIELFCAVRPGQTLELAAELESVDNETVGYSGTARVEGQPVLRLQDCVGPMVPLEEFDSPEALRERLAVLGGAGAASGGFEGLPALALEFLEGKPGRVARAVLKVPSTAPFFADHFPRRPVFPGTLLMHANLQTAAMLAAEVGGDNGVVWLPRTITDVKLRSFIPPGETMTLQASLTGRSDTCLDVAVESRMNGRLIGSAGIQFAPEAQS